ncbi:MAG: GNAT family N-acetyltransferase, partial [Pseudomonadota bacterium]
GAKEFVKRRNWRFSKQSHTRYTSRYTAHIEQVECSAETGRTLPHISTNRCTLVPLRVANTSNLDISNLPPEIHSLYENVFNDPQVMQSYASGMTSKPEAFCANVVRQSKRWDNGYPFAAFIVKDTEDSEQREEGEDVILGYEVIGNSEVLNAAELAYLLRKDAHGKHIASETVGALVCIYGQSLFDTHRSVNQVIGSDKSFTGGQLFQRVVATARQDNAPSQSVLRGLGFEPYGVTEKFGHTRDEFSRGFDETIDLVGAASHPSEDAGLMV